jgi:mRNA interferase MazF
VCYLEDFGVSRPVLVVQSDSFNRSLIPTVVVVPLTARLEMARAPGNVLVPARGSGLPADTVALVSAVQAIERRRLKETTALVSELLLDSVGQGLRLVQGI